jgi:hypothetical protein
MNEWRASRIRNLTTDAHRLTRIWNGQGAVAQRRRTRQGACHTRVPHVYAPNAPVMSELVFILIAERIRKQAWFFRSFAHGYCKTPHSLNIAPRGRGIGWQRLAMVGWRVVDVDTNCANEHELSRHRHHTRVPIESLVGAQENSPGSSAKRDHPG